MRPARICVKLGPRRATTSIVSFAPAARGTNTAISDTYDDPRAHALRERYLATFGGDELPVPVESIAEDLLGLAVERRELDVSGMLFPAERRILVNAAEPEAASASRSPTSWAIGSASASKVRLNPSTAVPKK